MCLSHNVHKAWDKAKLEVFAVHANAQCALYLPLPFCHPLFLSQSLSLCHPISVRALASLHPGSQLTVRYQETQRHAFIEGTWDSAHTFSMHCSIEFPSIDGCGSRMIK